MRGAICLLLYVSQIISAFDSEGGPFESKAVKVAQLLVKCITSNF